MKTIVFISLSLSILASEGIEPSTFGFPKVKLLWAQHATAAPTRFISLFLSLQLASEGLDPPSFGLWAQHASSAPTRLSFLSSLSLLLVLVPVLV